MNVDIFQSDPGYPSIRWYFASAIPMMALTLICWYIIKHFLARRRQTPYQRGIYEHLFFELATAYPKLWSRTGPKSYAEPRNWTDQLRWRLITLWNDPSKTVRAGAEDRDAEYDDLGTWSRLKRSLTRRWTSQIRIPDAEIEPSSTGLEEGKMVDSASQIVDDKASAAQATQFIRTAATGDIPGGQLEVPDHHPVAASTFMRRQTVVSRPSSAGTQTSSRANRNSGIMVEEEPSTWLRDYGVKINDVTLY